MISYLRDSFWFNPLLTILGMLIIYGALCLYGYIKEN